ncbi:MarR family winged helix-turn-helix transcriptional regulator [Methanosarcina vacuolata]|jgi:DNA-binding MarR family transcriptional regulator|nr:MarR family transcriptional regulator [Methanosarcina vacuolata]
MSDINERREMGLLILEREVLFNKLVERKYSEMISKARSSRPEKLGRQQFNAILIIGTMGEMIPSYLGLCMNMDRSSLSRMIDSMEKKGIVYRKTDIEDRRKVMINLTEKGEEYYEILKKKVEETQASTTDLLDEQDLKEYKACIKKEISILKKIDSKLNAKE